MPDTGTIVESLTVVDAPTIAFYGHNIEVAEAIEVADVPAMGVTELYKGDGIYNLVKFDVDYDFGFTMFVKSVIFVPGADDDNCVLYHDEVETAMIADIGCPDKDQHAQVIINRKVRIVFDASASTCSAGARLIVLT